MAFEVVARAAREFERWLAAQERRRAACRRGASAAQQVFLGVGCAAATRIAGTTRSGDVGPDLTHVGEPATLAAGDVPNTPRQPRRWIGDPQDVKPGT